MVNEGKHSCNFNVAFARVLQSLVGWEYFPYVFGVFDGKLGIELITCEDKKLVTVSSMQKKMERLLSQSSISS